MTKRKQQDSEAEGPKLSLEFAKTDVQKGVEGPFLAVFPGVTPPSSAAFTIYKPAAEEAKTKRKKRILAADTGKVEFVGQNFGENARQGYCRYVVAIRDKKTNKVVFKDAPVVAINRTVKALKTLKPSTIGQEFMLAKNALGEAFGTKKIKQQIKSVERNAVNVNTLESVANILTDKIAEKTSALPSKEEIKASADADRPIPPYDINATKVEDIYKFDTLITPAEYQIIPFKQLLEKDAKISMVLPYNRSTYVNEGLKAALSTSKKDRHRIRVLMYLSFLMAFRSIPDKKINNTEAVTTAMGICPSLIVENFYQRFTEKPESGAGDDRQKHTFTPKSKDKLLSWILAICLHLENFNMDAAALTHDLSLKQTRVNELFRSLGCKVSELTATQRAQLGLEASESQHMKRAILTVPLTFPLPKRGPKKAK